MNTANCMVCKFWTTTPALTQALHTIAGKRQLWGGEGRQVRL